LLTVLATSPRVAPGLLTWQAWSALRDAAVVMAPEGHPQLAALAAAGVTVTVAPGPPDDGVWLAPPGPAEVPAGAVLIEGSADLPGAHLLDLVATMDRLRAECPWDAKQTHLSLAPHLLEEPYEALEALESGNLDAFREELGDVLLQVVFHARIAENFGIDDVADGIVAKLVRRHPHVFGSVTVADAEEVKRNWDAIKKQERAERAVVPGADPAFTSALDGVPFGQPALALAAQLHRRAARAGAPESLTELAADDDARVVTESVSELGAELFRLVALAGRAGLDPEHELRMAARRYRDRVRAWERC
jgi:XTP/dITP diphosphohydrolase